MLCNLRCLKTRLGLLCNKSSMAQQPEPLSRQLKLCNVFTFGMAHRTRLSPSLFNRGESDVIFIREVDGHSSLPLTYILSSKPS